MKTLHRNRPLAGFVQSTLLAAALIGPCAAQSVSWRDAWPAAGDTADLTTLTSSDPIAGTNGGTTPATEQTNEPDHAGNAGGKSLWLLWKPDTSGRVKLSTRGTDAGELQFHTFDTLLSVYTTPPAGTTTAINTIRRVTANHDIRPNTAVAPALPNGDTGSEVIVEVTAGQVYWIALDGARPGTTGATAADAAQGEFALSITADATTPANDHLADAAEIQLNTPAASTNARGTAELNEPLHNALGLGASVWFKWTAPIGVSGIYDLTTSSSEINPLMTVYVANGGLSMANLKPISSSNNTTTVAPANLESLCRIAPVAGRTYYIAVDGLWTLPFEGPVTAPARLSRGAFTVGVAASTATRPENDLRINAIDLNAVGVVARGGLSSYGGSLTHTGISNVGATLDPDDEIDIQEPLLSPQTGYRSVWYLFKTPSGEPSDIIIETTGSTFDTLISVYSYFGQANLIGVNNDDGALTTSKFSGALDANTFFYVKVDGRNSTSTIQNVGDITLKVSRSAQAVLLRSRSAGWHYLNSATDPVADNANFWSQWNKSVPEYSVLPAGTVYAGPNFTANGTGLFGNGGIDAQDPPNTALTNKTTSFFKRYFNLDASAFIIAEVLADDTSIIYLDGVEVGVTNRGTVPAAPVFTSVSGVTASETVPIQVPLGSVAAGEHVIAFAVFNTTTGSSDLGFDAALLADFRSPVINSAITVTGVRDINFSYQISIVDAVAVTNYSLVAGNFPLGVSLSPTTGLVSGLPSVSGTYVVTLRAANPNGFDDETVTITIAPPLDIVALTAEGIGTSFEKSAPGTNNYVPSGVNPEVKFVNVTVPASGAFFVRSSATASTASTGTATYIQQNTPNVSPPYSTSMATAGRAFEGSQCVQKNNANQTLATDEEAKLIIGPIAPNGFTKLRAYLHHRNVSQTTSYFEATDFIEAYLETSLNALSDASITWTRLSSTPPAASLDLITKTFGGAPDALRLINTQSVGAADASNGDWKKFELSEVTLPVGTRQIRMVVNGAVDSASEFLLIDDVKFFGIGSGLVDSDSDGVDDAIEIATYGDLTQGPDDDTDRDGIKNSLDPEPLTLALKTLVRAAGNIVTLGFPSKKGAQYQIETSPDLRANSWITEDPVVAPSTYSEWQVPIPPAVLASPTGKIFARIRRLP
jgi:hypothetical protein